jgi:nucleotide-binding universal stress UspA family protein
MGSIGDPIVVGYIDTPEGLAAVERAILEARERHAALIIVNSQRGGASLDRETAERIDAAVEQVAERARERGLDVRVRQLVRDADPASDLISVAEEENADLIVIGLRRRSPVGKLILGSNAQSVLLDAPCPVLAVKADQD